MKTPQRRFVVEFKSGRRPQKSGTGSIWGDTDLKALAREVEDQSSHLFGADKKVLPEVTDASSATSASIPEGRPSVEDVVPEPMTEPMSLDRLGSAPAAVIGEIAEPTPPPSEPLTITKIDQVAEPLQTPIDPPTVSKGAKTLKKVPRKRVTRVLPVAVPSAQDEPQVPPVSAASTSADDLAGLEAENKRLRQLLANQLRAQNAELKRMLERF